MIEASARVLHITSGRHNWALYPRTSAARPSQCETTTTTTTAPRCQPRPGARNERPHPPASPTTSPRIPSEYMQPTLR